MYSIEVYSSPLPFPLSFAVHTWIILYDEGQGVHYRYEIHWLRGQRESNNCLFCNYQAKQEGMNKCFRKNITNDTTFFAGKLLGVQQIDRTTYDAIIETIHSYPYKNDYLHYPGPNSNTFVQYILTKYHIDIVLPYNAFGKGYKVL